MTRNYLTLGKFMVLLLAAVSPVLLFQGYRNQRDLLRSRADLFETLTEERESMVQEVVRNYFNDAVRLEGCVVRRSLPRGPIEGLAPFPDREQVASWGVSPGNQGNAEEHLVDLLLDDGLFPSGMPRRYAGLVELWRLGDVVLSPVLYQHFYQVAEDFWRGNMLDEATHAFLMGKLPEHIARFFQVQQHLVGAIPPLSADENLVSLRLGDYQYLLAPGTEELSELNRRLAAFDRGARLIPDHQWHQTGELRMTYRAEHEPLARPLSQMVFSYLGTGLGLELILLLIYVVLRKYETVNRTQKRLLATTSHELRTPLAVMRQFSEMLLDRKDKVPDRLHTYHQYIHRECLKMQFLVENLLSAARFENLVIEPVPASFDLRQMIEELAGAVDPLSQHQIRVRCEEQRVTWDQGLMSQVFTNLMENARVHAGTDLEVVVEGNATQVTLSFRDFGETPDLQKIAKIRAFKPDPKGLGLGLYLVKRIIHLHGGTLAFEDAQPGLRVCLSLPRHRPDGKERK